MVGINNSAQSEPVVRQKPTFCCLQYKKGAQGGFGNVVGAVVYLHVPISRGVKGTSSAVVLNGRTLRAVKSWVCGVAHRRGPAQLGTSQRTGQNFAEEISNIR
jgi:hypothetical protein